MRKMKKSEPAESKKGDFNEECLKKLSKQQMSEDKYDQWLIVTEEGYISLVCQKYDTKARNRLEK